MGKLEQDQGVAVSSDGRSAGPADPSPSTRSRPEAAVTNAFLNAAGAVLNALAGDRYKCVSFMLNRYEGTQHFSVYLHPTDTSVLSGIGDTLAEAFASAEKSKPFHHVPQMEAA